MNEPEHSVATGRRVLLVEDDPDHVTIAQHYLKRLGGRVSAIETCTTLRDAEHHLQDGAFELVLLDLTLPDSVLESTVDAIEDLCSHRVQIVAMSSLDVPEIRQRVLDCGAAAFLPKTKLDADSLTDVLDQLDAAEETVSTFPVPGATTAPAAKVEATTDRLDGEALASKLAHDANSWLTNASFRVAALHQHEGTRESSIVQEHLTSISKSLDAIASIVSGSHSILVNEMAPIALKPIDLNRRIPELFEDWRTSFPRSPLAVQHSGLPKIAADEAALSNLFSIFASNVLTHGGGTDGDHEIVLRLGQRTAPSGEFCTVTISDDGGPWNVLDPGRITDPTFRSDGTHAQPGLGLYRAERWMERMGGSLDVLPREDVPGAFAVHLHFRRPS